MTTQHYNSFNVHNLESCKLGLAYEAGKGASHLAYSSLSLYLPFSYSMRYLAATSAASSPKVSSKMVVVMKGLHSLYVASTSVPPLHERSKPGAMTLCSFAACFQDMQQPL